MSDARRAHPIVFLVLILPFGVMSGYLTVAVAYLLTKAGISVEQIAELDCGEFHSANLEIPVGAGRRHHAQPQDVVCPGGDRQRCRHLFDGSGAGQRWINRPFCTRSSSSRMSR